MTAEDRDQVRKLYHLECDTSTREARVFDSNDEYTGRYIAWLESVVRIYMHETASKMRGIIKIAADKVATSED